MKRRSGFTITELLVAMALIVFIMAILAEAFDSGITTFRRVKAISDMNERLRTATGVLRRYLAADHFEGKKRLSDPNFWADVDGNYSPPQGGVLSHPARHHGIHLRRGRLSGEYQQ